MQCRGAKSFVDDLDLSRGVVLSRAVALLRSIETKPFDSEICPLQTDASPTGWLCGPSGWLLWLAGPGCGWGWLACVVSPVGPCLASHWLGGLVGALPACLVKGAWFSLLLAAGLVLLRLPRFLRGGRFFFWLCRYLVLGTRLLVVCHGVESWCGAGVLVCWGVGVLVG